MGPNPSKDNWDKIFPPEWELGSFYKCENDEETYIGVSVLL